MHAIRMAEATNPREDIQLQVAGYLDGITVLGAKVLLGIYKRPERTKGGIILTDKHRDEDVFQGKVALVLATGPLAFTEDDTHKWGDRIPVVGDWVVVRVGDAWPLYLGDQPCRVSEDVDIKMIINQPDAVY